jgi:hypothetical protein
MTVPLPAPLAAALPLAPPLTLPLVGFAVPDADPLEGAVASGSPEAAKLPVVPVALSAWSLVVSPVAHPLATDATQPEASIPKMRAVT